MTSAELDAMFRQLWSCASKQARVMYNDAPAGRGTESGYFDPRVGTDRGPLISICDDSDRRKPLEPCWERGNGTILTEPEMLRDLITLAHEYGHLASHLDPQTQSDRPAYDAAVRRFHDGEPLCNGDAESILNEEERAWTNGRRVLAAMGFVAWDAFEGRETTGLDLYRRSLALRETQH